MENHQADLDAIFHALADPTRRAVIQTLVNGDATVGALAAPHEMGLPAFLKHLGVLEACGLVTSEKRGRVRTCSLCPGAMSATEQWFEAQRALWERRHAQLDDLITELKGKTDET